MPKPIGTISSAALFGPDNEVVHHDTAMAQASGLKSNDISPALWFIGMIGVLVLIRVVWESAR